MADDDKSDKDRDDTDQDDTDQDDDYTPPDKDSWDRTTSSLRKANEEAKKWRLRASGKDEKWEVPGWNRVAGNGDDDKGDGKPKPPKVDVAAERRQAEEEALAKIKPGLVSAAARDALRDAGLVVPQGKDKAEQAFKRAYRLIDMNEVEVDEDGAVTGVDEQVRAVKRDYPELFARKGGSRVDAGAGSSGDPGKKSDTSANKLAAMIRGE